MFPIPRRWRGSGRSQPGPGPALLGLVVVGLVVTVAAALLTGALARRAGSEAIARAFDEVAVVVAGSVVAPRLTPGAVQPGTAEAAALHGAVRALQRSGPVAGVVVRDPDGRVVWSDTTIAAGTTTGGSPLRPDQLRALRDGSVAREHDGDADTGVLTASVGVRDAGGGRVLVDVSARYRLLATGPGTAWTPVAAGVLGGLLVLQLLQVPFVWGLVTQLRRSRETGARLREAALAAGEAERRRVARQVHDEVLPQLHGLVYELDAVRLGAPGGQASTAVLDRAADGVRAGLGELRAVLAGSSRAELPRGGLAPALADLATRLEAIGIRVTLRVPPVDALPPDVAEVLYLCAREALRNVMAHSGAERVGIYLDVTVPEISLTVDDDGRGFEEARLTESRVDGHLGLPALGDLVTDSGGSLTASSSPGRGTQVVVRVPWHDWGVDMREHR